MQFPLFLQSPHKDVQYTMVGDTTAQEYFMVDENTGHISLKKSVVLDPERRTAYTVSWVLINSSIIQLRIQYNRKHSKLNIFGNSR